MITARWAIYLARRDERDRRRNLDRKGQKRKATTTARKKEKNQEMPTTRHNRRLDCVHRRHPNGPHTPRLRLIIVIRAEALYFFPWPPENSPSGFLEPNYDSICRPWSIISALQRPSSSIWAADASRPIAGWTLFFGDRCPIPGMTRIFGSYAHRRGSQSLSTFQLDKSCSVPVVQWLQWNPTGPSCRLGSETAFILKCMWFCMKCMRFYQVLPSFTRLYWVLLRFTEFAKFDLVLPGYTGFYLVLPSFTRRFT